MIQQSPETFLQHEIVWAKVKSYPWWPAEVSCLPTPDRNFYKVCFIAEETHAFLNVKDVRKYHQYYQENSKKKTKGLGQAIDKADLILRERAEHAEKEKEYKAKKTMKSGNKLGKSTNGKPIRKGNRNGCQKKPSQAAQEFQNYQSEDNSQNDAGTSLVKRMSFCENPKISKGKSFQSVELRGNHSKEMLEEQYSSEIQEPVSICQSSDKSERDYESEQKAIDRARIDKIEEELLQIIDDIKQGNHNTREQYYKRISEIPFSGQELVQSRITNMLSYIARLQGARPEGKNEAALIRQVAKDIKDSIMNYLIDTSYYDQLIRTVSKNRRNRVELQNKLISYLRLNYKIRKDLAEQFANRLGQAVTSGSIDNQKKLVQMLKLKLIELPLINNKAAVQRAYQQISLLYAGDR